MFVLLKSRMTSGRLYEPCWLTAEITVDRLVFTLTSRLTVLEIPVDWIVPWLTAVERPVESAVA